MCLHFVALASLLGSGVASAKTEKPSRSYRTQWLIEPTPVPETQQSAKEGELLIQQRLVPLGMVTLAADFEGLEPDQGIAKGTQLILADGAEKPVYCSTSYRRPGALTRILSTGPETGTQRCFVDSDNDGSFDQTFVGFNNVQVLPGVFGRLPKTPILIAPLAYAKANVSDFAEKYYVGIQYLGQSGAGKKRRFRLVYGSEKPWGSFSFEEMIDGMRTKRDTDLPMPITRLGAIIIILGGEQGSVDYRVQRMMQPQPFGVIVETMYY